MTRRSIIVMLPEDLVARADARAQALTVSGHPTSRDDLIGEALSMHLEAAAPPAARRVESARPAAIDAVARQVPEQLASVRQQVAGSLSRGRRRADDLVQQLRSTARDGDRAAWGVVASRLPDALSATHQQITEAFDQMAAVVVQGAQVLAGAIPALAEDARSRWLSAQAGARLAPDRVLTAGRAIEAAVEARAQLGPALRELTDALAKARAALHRHAQDVRPPASDLQLPGDLDDGTWGAATGPAIATAAAGLAAQLEVLEVGFEHGDKLAVSHLQVLLSIAREVTTHLSVVPDVAAACD
jgi:hypothetical protein